MTQTVVTKGCAPLLLKLAHDESGHNGSARTYMILRRLYFWKGMKSQIYQYVEAMQGLPTTQYNTSKIYKRPF